MIRSKSCFKCHKTKPLAEFYRHAQMGDGHLNKCKECTRADVRLHRQLNESVREYDRKRSRLPHRKAKKAEWLRRYREKNRPASRAHVIAARQRLPKKPCHFCGATKNLHKHHGDYSKPLAVVWLCARCHHRLHALQKTG